MSKYNQGEIKNTITVMRTIKNNDISFHPRELAFDLTNLKIKQIETIPNTSAK